MSNNSWHISGRQMHVTSTPRYSLHACMPCKTGIHADSSMHQQDPVDDCELHRGTVICLAAKSLTLTIWVHRQRGVRYSCQPTALRQEEDWVCEHIQQAPL